MARLQAIILLIFVSYPVVSIGETIAGQFEFTDNEDNEISIGQLPPGRPGDLLALWFVDHDEPRPVFEKMLSDLAASGIEIWRIDLLRDLFLPRSSENIRTLSGNSITAVIDIAVSRSDKTLLLISYDRMSLPLLRGLRHWQARGKALHRVAGAALFYPNLFGPTPRAGEPPDIDPVVTATTYPVALFQPEYGSHRWRTSDMMEAFWQAGAPAYLFRIPQIRDWFFMGEEEQLAPATRNAIEQMPQMLQAARHLLQQHVPDSTVRPLLAAKQSQPMSSGLEPVTHPAPPPTYSLPDRRGQMRHSTDYRDKVTLVVFWATWCPPCVEELPSLNRLADHFGSRDFEIVSIDFQESPELLETFLQKVPVDFPVLLDSDGSIARDWGVFSFPSSFLLDHDGKIRFTVNKAIDWNTPEVRQVIELLLNE
jgi:thiol-disulfide isomerase/thioredoxin